MLPLRELALDSHAYRQQPSMPRPQYSHLDNEGVKGLVDSICNRMRSGEQCEHTCSRSVVQKTCTFSAMAVLHAG